MVRVLGHWPPSAGTHPAKVALVALAVYLLSPLDPPGASFPVLGLADDVLLAAVVLDGVLGFVDGSVLLRYWPGSPASLASTAAITDGITRLVPSRIKNRDLLALIATRRAGPSARGTERPVSDGDGRSATRRSVPFGTLQTPLPTRGWGRGEGGSDRCASAITTVPDRVSWERASRPESALSRAPFSYEFTAAISSVVTRRSSRRTCFVVGGGAVHGRARCPNHQVADLPGVPIDVVAVGSVLGEVARRRRASGIGRRRCARVRSEVERLANR